MAKKRVYTIGKKYRVIRHSLVGDAREIPLGETATLEGVIHFTRAKFPDRLTVRRGSRHYDVFPLDVEEA